MAPIKILVVETEQTVSKEIEKKLRLLGYAVLSTGGSLQEMIRKAVESRPDLVLLHLQPEVQEDTLETTKQVKEQLDIPVLCLADPPMQKGSQRTKEIMPSACLSNVPEENALHLSIETALYQHKMQRLWRRLQQLDQCVVSEAK